MGLPLTGIETIYLIWLLIESERLRTEVSTALAIKILVIQ